MLGGAATAGTITVTDNLPNGLTFVSGTGTGWTCSAVGQMVTCTSATVIAAGASASAITLVVSVGPAAAPSVTNTATVSGGGEPAAATGNNSASDPTSVTTTAASQFAPDNTLTASPGTTVSYPHTFNAGVAGTLSFSTTSAQSPAVSGWTQVIYRDSDCSGGLNGAEGVTPLTGSIAVNAGEAVCIVVRDAIPATAPQNAQNIITVTATFNAQTFTRTDVTIVGAGSGAGLVLSKQVRNVTQGGTATTANTARPDDVLEYTITYTNTGAGPVTSIVVTDSTPSFTLYQAATCVLPLPANVTACTVTTQPAVNGTGSVSWTLAGSLMSGASGTVSYTVRVQP
jgi:mucin-19